MTAELGLVGRAATRRFLEALYRNAPDGSLVEVRFRLPSGMGQCFQSARALTAVVDVIDGLASTTDVYVGVVPRARRAGGRADLVDRASVVWVDCDTPEAVTALASFRPRPSIVVGSGSGENRHAYWLVEEPVDVAQVEGLNRRLAIALEADPRSSDRARILRPAGSVNRKHSTPAPVRLLGLDERHRLGVGELERRLPAADPTRETPPRRHSSGRDVSGDPLRSLPPRMYVERLTGQPVDRSGKIRCPFHEDRTPSLHVYKDPERGWYCFGCGRGGSVYDLAALLWDRGTQGREFRQLRRDLGQELER